MKIITGLINPTAGVVRFNGTDIQDDLFTYKSQVGYVPEEPHIYSYLTGSEYLYLVGRLRGIPQVVLDYKIDGMLRQFMLGDYRDTPISSYSKGMKQKILIAAALLHNPAVLILDEPLSGLDVTTTLIFRRLMVQLAAAGKTVLCSSHELSLLESACSNFVILRGGRVAAQGSMDELRDLRKLPSLEAIFADVIASENIEEVAANISKLVIEE